MAKDRLWVYNSENWFLGSPNLSAPLVFWPALNSKVGQKGDGLIYTPDPSLAESKVILKRIWGKKFGKVQNKMGHQARAQCCYIYTLLTCCFVDLLIFIVAILQGIGLARQGVGSSSWHCKTEGSWDLVDRTLTICQNTPDKAGGHQQLPNFSCKNWEFGSILHMIFFLIKYCCF